MKKNEARLYFKGEQFLIWQNDNLDWCYGYQDLLDVNTTQKDLQQALNSVYETIEDRNPHLVGEQRKRGGKGRGVVRTFH